MRKRYWLRGGVIGLVVGFCAYLWSLYKIGCLLPGSTEPQCSNGLTMFLSYIRLDLDPTLLISVCGYTVLGIFAGLIYGRGRNTVDRYE